MIKVMIILVLSTAALSCGIKGPPRPPEHEETTQETIQKQKSADTISADTTRVKTKKK